MFTKYVPRQLRTLQGSRRQNGHLTVKSIKYGRRFIFDEKKKKNCASYSNKRSFPNEAKMKKEQQKEKGDVYQYLLPQKK